MIHIYYGYLILSNGYIPMTAKVSISNITGIKKSNEIQSVSAKKTFKVNLHLCYFPFLYKQAFPFRLHIHSSYILSHKAEYGYYQPAEKQYKTYGGSVSGVSFPKARVFIISTIRYTAEHTAVTQPNTPVNLSGEAAKSMNPSMAYFVKRHALHLLSPERRFTFSNSTHLGIKAYPGEYPLGKSLSLRHAHDSFHHFPFHEPEIQHAVSDLNVAVPVHQLIKSSRKNASDLRLSFS